MSNIKNPNAAVIVWTYKQRLTHKPSSDVHDVHETVLNTVSLMSIQTNKTKNAPNGTFSFTLAPYKNWVGFIAPGSWCAILMTQDDLPEINKFTYKAKENELKFFGRINSVRCAVHVGENGERQTVYVCEGEDWGSVFNSVLYIDTSIRQPTESQVGIASTLIYGDVTNEVVKGEVPPPSTTKNIEVLLDLWGNQSSFLSGIDAAFDAAGGAGSNVILHPDAVYKIPKEAKKFLGASSDSIANLVNNSDSLKTGILTGYDEYSDTSESVGIIDPNSVFGSNPIWSVMKDNSNEIVNEMFCDLRWVGGKPKLALYKRVRPFLTRDVSPSTSKGPASLDINSAGDIVPVSPSEQLFDSLSDDSGGSVLDSDKIVADISSKLQYVRRVKIPKNEVLAFDAGTNWRDKLNFVEILPDESQFQYNGQSLGINTASKGYAQIADSEAFGREGLKAAKFTSRFYPLDLQGNPNFYDFSAWCKVLAQWYFNSHNYLNGTIEFIGQNTFIGVGDNLLVDASIMGPKPNINRQQLANPGNSYLLLHVESLSHNFSIDSNGTRHWSTTVQFTRGVVCDKNGVPTDITALDPDTSLMNPTQERNNYNTISTSSEPADPDVQKVRGT